MLCAPAPLATRGVRLRDMRVVSRWNPPCWITLGESVVTMMLGATPASGVGWAASGAGYAMPVDTASASAPTIARQPLAAARAFARNIIEFPLDAIAARTFCACHAIRASCAAPRRCTPRRAGLPLGVAPLPRRPTCTAREHLAERRALQGLDPPREGLARTLRAPCELHARG